MTEETKKKPYEECEIERFFHCKRCIQELPMGMSPMEYSRLSVGQTFEGIQVWCNRHDMEVTHIRGFHALRKH